MRDFSNQNLRGRDFRGQDLRGANFSGADIRGARFVDADLQGADFTGAIAGLQRRWAIVQVLLAFVISMILNFALVVCNILAVSYLFSDLTFRESAIIPIIVFISLMLGLFLILIKEGFTVKALLMAGFLIAVVFIGSGGFISTHVFGGMFTLAIAAIITNLISIVSFAIMKNMFALTLLANLLTFVFVLVFINSSLLIAANVRTNVNAFIFIFEIVVVFLGLYVSWQASKENKKFELVRRSSVTFGALGGTSFRGANLTDANFNQTILKTTNFANSRKQTTNLTRTHLQNSKQLNKARPGTAIFANFKVLQLLTTGQGNNQDFSNLNLRGANLDSANLNGANLKNANLTEASLQSTDLQNANLTELQAIATNFTKAYLTGACLEAWNIQNAILTGIHCDYYFLLESPDAKGNRERRPHNPDRTYEPGDAEKILTEAQNIVEVLLKQCTTAKDLAQALQYLTAIHPEANLQKLERKDNDFLVTLTVPPETEKSDIETLLHNAYDEIRILRGENKELQTLRAVDLKDVALAIANTPVNVNQTNQQTTGDHTMSTQDTTQSNQAISTGSSSFINTGTLSATNSTLGIISGNATTTIGALPTPEAHQPDLKTALTDLKTAIEASTLSDEDKADALEQLTSIATAGQTPKDNAIQKVVKTAMKILKGTIADLPATEDVVKVMIRIAPIVAAFFGMPAI